MKKITIKAELREVTGKKATKKLSAINHVPCVLYGFKDGNVHFHAHRNDFRHIIYTPNSFLVELEINGKKHDAIMKDLQFHPVSDDVIHIDFIRYNNEMPLTIDIPIKTHGLPKGVQDGGALEINKSKLLVSGIAENLPDILDIDVADLKLGSSIKVSDLSYENLELKDPANSVVCAVHVTRLAKSMDEEAAEAEAEAEAEVEGETEEKAE